MPPSIALILFFVEKENKMKDKMTWIISLTLLCGAVAPVTAHVKKGKAAVKEKKGKKHTIGCNCGNRPPKTPKFWYWFKS